MIKTSLSSLAVLVTGLAGALLSNGCGHNSPPPRTTRIITPAPVIVQSPAEPRPITVVTAPTQPGRTQPAPNPTISATPSSSAPQNTLGGLPPSGTPQAQAQGAVTIEDTLDNSAAQVLKMYESGVSEEVITSYANASNEPFNLSPDHIIYFTDIGLPETVITGMIQHDQALGVATVDISANEPAYTGNSTPSNLGNTTSAPVYAQSPPQSQASVTPAVATQTVIVEQRPAVTTQVFYDALSPYGTWIYLDDYGWTWQPTVATVNVNWRPYYDRGRWAYTDAGWYWHSGYSWGWAPFHYGRWARQTGYGWVWVPGSTWAPSWVSWRYSDAYCGWAPLPPYADYQVGIGFSYRGSRVSAGFSFGLGYNHYSFVNRRHFGRRHHYRHNDRIDRNRSEQVYNDSTVINNYIVGDNNTIINEGISRDRVNRGTDSEVRQVRLADVGDSSRAADRRRNGNQEEAIPVYRPKVADGKARPSERQLARQETRATRKKIEERSGRSLDQEPTRRMTRGASSGSSLAKSSAASTGRIAPNRTSRSSVSTSNLSRLGATSGNLNNSTTAVSRGSRGIPNATRTVANTKPSRPSPTRASVPRDKGGASRLTGISKSSVPSSASRVTSRNETNAKRAAQSRARLETRANQRANSTARAVPSQRPSRLSTTTQTSSSRASSSNLSKRTTASPSSKRIAPSYQAPSSQSSRTQTTPRGSVQDRTRTSTPSASRNRITQQPTRRNTPAVPTYRAPARNEVSPQRSPSTSNSRGLSRMSRQPSTTSRSVTPRNTTRPSYQQRRVPTPPSTRPSYQAPRRQASPPAQTRQSAPSVQRQRSTAPSVQRQRSTSPSRTYSPTPTRTPSRTQVSRPSSSASSRSRSSAFSSQRSSSQSRSTPQRSRGVPKR